MSDVDLKVLLMYEKLEQAGLLRPVSELSPDQERKQELNALRLFMHPGSEEKIALIENVSISRSRDEGKIHLRIYYP